MKLRNIIGIMLLSLTALFVQSCSDSDNAGTASKLIVTKDSVAVDAISFQIPASNQMIGVLCDADWTAVESDTSWLQISNHAGYGDSIRSYVRVSVKRNSSSNRTGTITFTSGSMTKVITVNQSGAGLDPGDPFDSSYGIINNLTLGYNLGNTLDSNPYGSWFDEGVAKNPDKVDSLYEVGWGQPYTTKEMIDEIAGKGFNIIRVPVTWYPHIAGFKKDGTGDYTISATWLARVKQVVDYVLANNCYCVINVMHDTGANNGSGDPNSAWLNTSADSYAVNSKIYKQIWTQVANYFKDYGDHLIFESFNEILNSSSSWTAPTDDSNGDYTTVNKLNQDFVDAVRATGGNNEYRNLFFAGYSASSTQTVINALQVPNDKHPNHLIATMHSYDPYNFCNNNGEYNVLVFNDECKKEIDAIFTRTAKRFDDLGVPYIFGEFGAIDEDKDMNERINYATYVATKMKTYGTTGLWWMGLYNRSKNTWYESEIVNALFAAKN